MGHSFQKINHDFSSCESSTNTPPSLVKVIRALCSFVLFLLCFTWYLVVRFAACVYANVERPIHIKSIRCNELTVSEHTKRRFSTVQLFYKNTTKDNKIICMSLCAHIPSPSFVNRQRNNERTL